MKRATLAVFALSSVLVAQNVPTPKAELAEVLAIEEQEGDLERAEKLYRDKIDNGDLSVPARAFANLRLGMLLERLGRKDEAKPFLDFAAKSSHIVLEPAVQGQDAERQKVLREKAAAIAKSVLEQSVQNWQAPLHGISPRRNADQLLWLGEAAVPAIVAALQAEVGKVDPGAKSYGVSGLAGFLWQVGGNAAAEFLASCTKIEDLSFRLAVVRTAFQAGDDRMLAVAAQFLADPDEGGEVVQTLLLGSGKGSEDQLRFRLDPNLIVEAALLGPPVGLRRMFEWARNDRVLSPETLAKAHRRVRSLLQSTDPELGAGAQMFLCTGTSQQSVEGVELLLDELPRMASTQPPSYAHFGGERRELTPADARRLLPHLDVCVKALGRDGSEDGQRSGWLRDTMYRVAHAYGPGGETYVLDWMKLGHNLWHALKDKIDASNSKAAAALIGTDKDEVGTALYVLREAEKLSVDTFPVLRERAEAVRSTSGDMNAFAMPMALTGNSEAADWILAEWRRKSDGPTGWAENALVRLGQTVRTDNVRAALREVAGDGAQRHEAEILALLAMGDEAALELVVKTISSPRSRVHPYAAALIEDRPSLTPLQYLLYDNPDPAHGYRDAQIHEVIRGATKDFGEMLKPARYSVKAIPDRHLEVIAEQAILVKRPNDASKAWVHEYMARMRDPASSTTKERVIAWCKRLLLGKDRASTLRVMSSLRSEDVPLFRDALEQLLDGADEGIAEEAAGELRRAEVAVGLEWCQRFATHRFAKVRVHAVMLAEDIGSAAEAAIVPLLQDEEHSTRWAAANWLGVIVSKAAVPRLINLLRDQNSGVRKVAAESLTRIRFYHEQEAHWDRVLKGLDASPASAAEKLLLQAKPGQPREQRILAIKSLGVLGQPEALPFLIEWTADADKEIAQHAVAAIGQIHLSGKK